MKNRVDFPGGRREKELTQSDKDAIFHSREGLNGL